MSDTESDPWKWLRRFWKAVDDFGNLQTLWQLAFAFGASAWIQSRLPGGWHPPQYWLAAAFAFFGAWAVAALVSRAVTSFSRAARRRTKLRVQFEPHGGGQFTVEVLNLAGDFEAQAAAQLLPLEGGLVFHRSESFPVRWVGEGGSDRVHLRAGLPRQIILARHIETELVVLSGSEWMQRWQRPPVRVATGLREPRVDLAPFAIRLVVRDANVPTRIISADFKVTSVGGARDRIEAQKQTGGEV